MLQLSRKNLMLSGNGTHDALANPKSELEMLICRNLVIPVFRNPDCAIEIYSYRFLNNNFASDIGQENRGSTYIYTCDYDKNRGSIRPGDFKSQI